MGMINIDVGALSAAELKRLVQAMRSRGQHDIADELSAAWAARRAGVAPSGAMAEPVNASAQPLPAPTGRRPWPVLAASVAAVLAVAGLGWTVALPSLVRGPQARAVVPTAALVRPDAPRRAEVALATYPPPAEPAATPAPAETKANPCLELATAFERLVCGFPAVAARHRRLQAAYDAAIARGADPATLDQPAWLRGVSRISDRTVLMERMEGRIRELAIADQPSADAARGTR